MAPGHLPHTNTANRNPYKFTFGTRSVDKIHATFFPRLVLHNRQPGPPLIAYLEINDILRKRTGPLGAVLIARRVPTCGSYSSAPQLRTNLVSRPTSILIPYPTRPARHNGSQAHIRPAWALQSRSWKSLSAGTRLTVGFPLPERLSFTVLTIKFSTACCMAPSEYPTLLPFLSASPATVIPPDAYAPRLPNRWLTLSSFCPFPRRCFCQTP